MKNKLESSDKFPTLADNHDINGLLDLLKEFVYSTKDTQEPYSIMVDTMHKLHNCWQGPQESDASFYKRLKSQVEVTESTWGPLVPNVMKGKRTEEQDKARNAYLARLFLKLLFKNRHNEHVRDLAKAYIDGQDQHPKDMESALQWIASRNETTSGKSKQAPPPSQPNGNNTSGAQTGTTSFSGAQQGTTPATTPEPAQGPSTGSGTAASAGTTSFSGGQITRENYKPRRSADIFRQ